MLAISVPALVGAGLALCGTWLFAEPYWPSLALTGVLLCGQVAYGLYLIPMNYLVQAAGLPKFSSLASVSGAALILIGIFGFGREFGAIGVAYATAGGFVVMAVVAVILTRTLKIGIRWQSWKSCWLESSIGLLGLACSVAALSFPPGEALAHSFAAASIVIVAIALATAFRRPLITPEHLQ